MRLKRLRSTSLQRRTIWREYPHHSRQAQPFAAGGARNITAQVNNNGIWQTLGVTDGYYDQHQKAGLLDHVVRHAKHEEGNAA